MICQVNDTRMSPESMSDLQGLVSARTNLSFNITRLNHFPSVSISLIGIIFHRHNHNRSRHNISELMQIDMFTQ